MKYAIMSDVHGNAEAFDIALKDAIRDQNADAVILLGDVVGYGPEPAQCIKLARQFCDVILKGNHEAGICRDMSLSWFSQTAHDGIIAHRMLLTKEDKDWMHRLQYTKTLPLADNKGVFVCTHGSFKCPENFDYITSAYEAADDIAHARISRNSGIIFCGHTHRAAVYTCEDKKKNDGAVKVLDLMKGEELLIQKDVKDPIKIDSDHGYVFNVGSVGYARAQDFSSYALFDTEAMTVTYRTLDFDFKSLADRLTATDIDIPSWLSYALERIELKRTREI